MAVAAVNGLRTALACRSRVCELPALQPTLVPGAPDPDVAQLRTAQTYRAQTQTHRTFDVLCAPEGPGRERPP